MTAPKKPRLLPCPFCGGRGTLDQFDMSKPDQNWNVVVCKRCGATFQDVFNTEKLAIDAWNKRATRRGK